jgi:hypothetical protein
MTPPRIDQIRVRGQQPFGARSVSNRSLDEYADERVRQVGVTA